MSLARCFPDLSIPPGVARRLVHRLVFEDRDDFDDVPGLARSVARALRDRGRIDRLVVADRRASQLDPFVKYLFRAPDGSAFEAVRIPLERPRFSICVSTQVGCGVGCAFCQTGRLGFTRNLEAWEMVDQVLTIRREAVERPVTGVVFQGQGEPLLNYDNVIRAAQVCRDPSGLRIGADRITISTVGVLPMIERYTEEGHPFRLILSLVSAFDQKRARIVPLARHHGIESLAAALRRHAQRRRGLVHVAWVLISGLNTDPEEARELARLFSGVRLRVSVVDVNDPTGAWAPPEDAERKRFLSALADQGIAFVRRYSGGVDIHAACGMLASRSGGGRPFVPSPPEPPQNRRR